MKDQSGANYGNATRKYQKDVFYIVTVYDC